jgi:hypothetical protein
MPLVQRTKAQKVFKQSGSGGLNTCSRALAALLVPVDGEPLVSVSFPAIDRSSRHLSRSSQHLRIVDKYSVAPATVYVELTKNATAFDRLPALLCAVI